MMKVNIKNFQAIEDLDLEIDGFTVIVGRTNIGKSSIVRAIKGAFENKSGKAFVRKGKTHSEVTIQCPEVELTWKKGDGYNDYDIDGEELKSVGYGAPPLLKEKGFRDLELSRDTVSVQMVDQFRPIFLLDPSTTSGSSAAEVISDVGRLGEVQTALVQASKDRREKRSEERVRQQDLKDTNEELLFYRDLSDDLLVMEEVEAAKDACEKTSNTLDFLKTLQGKVERRQEDLDFYDGIDRVDVPDISLGKELQELRELSSLKSRVSEAYKSFQRYQDIDKVDVPDTSSLDGILEQYRNLQDWQSKVEKHKAEIKKMDQKLPEIEEELKEAEDQIHKELSDHGRCPICNQDVE